jgi:hypothetical protein
VLAPSGSHVQQGRLIRKAVSPARTEARAFWELTRSGAKQDHVSGALVPSGPGSRSSFDEIALSEVGSSLSYRQHSVIAPTLRCGCSHRSIAPDSGVSPTILEHCLAQSAEARFIPAL